MNHLDPRLLDVFYEVQRDLPRQGPGNRDCTLKALSLCSSLPDRPEILDIGCGPGMQTMVLAKATTGCITAVDNCDEYLAELRRRAKESSLSHRVKVENADMTALGFPAASFDLIWCEGAAYIMGIREALHAWRPLLRRSGYVAFTELVWLDESPPAEVAEFFGAEYPAMTNISGIIAVIRESGYRFIGGFTLPDSAWWADYYTPLSAKLPALKAKYQPDKQALGIVAMSETEIEMRRRFGAWYGYQFLIAQKIE